MQCDIKGEFQQSGWAGQHWVGLPRGCRSSMLTWHRAQSHLDTWFVTTEKDKKNKRKKGWEREREKIGSKKKTARSRHADASEAIEQPKHHMVVWLSCSTQLERAVADAQSRVGELMADL